MRAVLGKHGAIAVLLAWGSAQEAFAADGQLRNQRITRVVAEFGASSLEVSSRLSYVVPPDDVMLSRPFSDD
jgi:hypothetical protein